jgi:hypothetical protein
MKNSKTIEDRILARISRMKSSVVLREDFIDLGGYDQIGRGLRQLAPKGRILKIGYGLYAKTKVSSLTGEVLPVQALPTLARQALKRLGVEERLKILVFKSLEGLIVSGQRQTGSRIVLPGRQSKIGTASAVRRLLHLEGGLQER